MAFRTYSLIISVVIVGPAGCMPQERINRSCEWRNDTVLTAPPRSAGRWDHLKEDARVAQDLGIRYGDSVGGRIWNDANRRARESCTNASLQQIMRQHGVSRAEIVAVTGARELWLDLLLVIAPMLVLFVAASRVVVRQVTADYDPEDRWVVVIILVFLTPIVAFIGVGLAQIWAVVIEEYRLRSDHISYRAAYLPLYVYKEVAWAIAGALFFGVAAHVRGQPVSARDRRSYRA